MLDKAQHDYDVFITVDKNMPRQLNLLNYNIGVIIILAPNNTLNELRKLSPAIEKILSDGGFVGERVVEA